MTKVDTLLEMANAAKIEEQKFEKGNKSSGTRLRKFLLEIGKLTKEIRKEVSEKKNA
ncbi:hypothetical protein [Flavobacterium sp. JP2137]|uniref:hypothetical protein n=1 Tax=Flavobacterium sp. JP2137 TaxID=3414510 RepID=UPI003D2FAAAC